MENQRKNWRAEFFLKKIKKQGTFKKKILQWKNFAIKKNSSLGSSAAPPPPALWDPPRRGPLSHCGDQGAALREGQRAGEAGQPAVAAEDHRAHQPGRWGPVSASIAGERGRERWMDVPVARRPLRHQPAGPLLSSPGEIQRPEAARMGEVREGGKRNSEWERRGGMEKYRVGPAHFVVDREFACLRATVKSRLRVISPDRQSSHATRWAKPRYNERAKPRYK